MQGVWSLGNVGYDYLRLGDKVPWSMRACSSLTDLAISNLDILGDPLRQRHAAVAPLFWWRQLTTVVAGRSFYAAYLMIFCEEPRFAWIFMRRLSSGNIPWIGRGCLSYPFSYGYTLIFIGDGEECVFHCYAWLLILNIFTAAKLEGWSAATCDDCFLRRENKFCFSHQLDQNRNY